MQNLTKKASFSFIIACGILIPIWGINPVPQPEWLNYASFIIGPLLIISAIILNKDIQNSTREKLN